MIKIIVPDKATKDAMIAESRYVHDSHIDSEKAGTLMHLHLIPDDWWVIDSSLGEELSSRPPVYTGNVTDEDKEMMSAMQRHREKLTLKVEVSATLQDFEFVWYSDDMAYVQFAPMVGFDADYAKDAIVDALREIFPTLSFGEVTSDDCLPPQQINITRNVTLEELQAFGYPVHNEGENWK